MTDLFRAWSALAALSAATTAIALSEIAAPFGGAMILMAAWAKARLIFVWYLGLADVPNWRQGILFVMALYFLALFGLYLAA